MVIAEIVFLQDRIVELRAALFDLLQYYERLKINRFKMDSHQLEHLRSGTHEHSHPHQLRPLVEGQHTSRTK
jgi:hypothetical protein